MQNAEQTCFCGSGKPYQSCCEPYHLHKDIAPTPDALMRSRYSAYVLGLGEYLYETWHPNYRSHVSAQALAENSNDTRWLSLSVVDAPVAVDTEGFVEFVARFVPSESTHLQHISYIKERSRFLKEGERWFYADGTLSEGVEKCSRNDPCPCGSGKKFKKCCSL